MPVLGISQDDAEATEKFRQQFEVKIESVLDLASEGYLASNEFGVHHVPTMFVLDEKGKIAERIEGFDKDALERLGACFAESERVPEFRPG
jgi:peroxiredoxin